jgi:hypothetical protein
MDKPRGEDKDAQDDEQESTSEAEDEEYYSSQESQEILNEERNGSGKEDQSGEVYVTRSGRTSKPPERLIYDAKACLLSSEDYEEQEWMEQQLLFFKASTDPDTMYYHQAMKEPDKEQFLAAIDKECEAHFKEGNYKLVKRSKLPEGATLLSSVWQMKRKRKPSTGEISKYKARMNVDGSKMIKGLHYEETYAPVVQWATIRFFMIASGIL